MADGDEAAVLINYELFASWNKVSEIAFILTPATFVELYQYT